ncbi:MAG: hypothetical protein IJT27_02020 [Clostridia bacterium]|nr:hypothetical protein [Clostridia bacterium]
MLDFDLSDFQAVLQELPEKGSSPAAYIEWFAKALQAFFASVKAIFSSFGKKDEEGTTAGA